MVIMLIHEMDGNTAVLCPRGQHRSMDMLTVHTLTTEVGEECWVNVHDALWVLHYIYRGDETEVACQHNEVNPMLLHQSNGSSSLPKLCTGERMTWYA